MCDIADVLVTQSALHGDAIERGITDWSRTWKCPSFDGEIEFYFLLRLRFAELVIDTVLKEGRDWSATIGEPPAPDNESEFLLWLLIRAWNGLGQRWLRALGEKEMVQLAEQLPRD